MSQESFRRGKYGKYGYTYAFGDGYHGQFIVPAGANRGIHAVCSHRHASPNAAMNCARKMAPTAVEGTVFKTTRGTK